MENRTSNVMGWYVVLLNAVMGSAMAAHFSQFSMTVMQLSRFMDAPLETLLLSDIVKSFAIVVGMMISGAVYKRLGMRRTFAISIMLLVIPQLLIPYNQSIPLLFLLKIFQGLNAIIFPLFLIGIFQWMPDYNQGIATALFNGIFFGGGGIGALLSGYAINLFGWIGSYWALALISLLLGVIWIFTIKEKNEEVFKSHNESGSKAIYREIVKMPLTWILILVFVAYTWVIQVINVNMPIFVETIGYNPINIGRVMTAASIGMIISSIISGSLSDYMAGRSESKVLARTIVILFGAVIIIVASILLVVLDLKSFKTLYSVVFLFSFGGAWGLGAFWSIVSELFEGEALSVVTGFTGGAADLSMPFAPIVVGVIFGANGLWDMAWLSCMLIGLISGLAGVYLIWSNKNRLLRNESCYQKNPFEVN
jgi:NNP family nitrate/nitrite transporter-like MFS transporter